MKTRSHAPRIVLIGTAGASRAAGRDLSALGVGRIVVLGSTPGEAAETAAFIGDPAVGGADLSDASGADLVILAGSGEAVTSGPPARVGELLRVCPEAIVIVCGPKANARAAAFIGASRFPPSRVMAASGVAAQEAIAADLARRLAVAPSQISVLVAGGDEPDLIVLGRYSTVAGIPVRAFPQTDAGREGNRHASAIPAPAEMAARASRAVARIAAAVLQDRREVLCCGVQLDGILGLPRCHATFPSVIGRGGVREIFQVSLTVEERSAIQKAAQTGTGRTT